MNQDAIGIKRDLLVNKREANMNIGRNNPLQIRDYSIDAEDDRGYQT